MGDALHTFVEGVKTRPGPPTTAPAAAADPTLGSVPAAPADSPGAAEEPPPSAAPPPAGALETAAGTAAAAAAAARRPCERGFAAGAVSFFDAFCLAEDNEGPTAVAAAAGDAATEGVGTAAVFSFPVPRERLLFGAAVFFVEAFPLAEAGERAGGASALAVGAEAVVSIEGVEATSAFSFDCPWTGSRTRRSTILTQSMILLFLLFSLPLRSARVVRASS